MYETNKCLCQEYLKILQSSREFQSIWKSSDVDFSGLFLAGVPDNYDSSENKIMVIGRETKGWGKQFNNNYSLLEYIELQAQKAHDYLKSKKDKLRNERGSSFHNFVMQIAKQGGENAIVWANLHCYSWKESRTDKSPLASEIDILSHELLKAQIDTLRPKYIILAHGVAKYSIELRRKLFPNKECVTLFEPDFDTVGNKQIWKFQFQWAPDYSITCFRVQHPSSTSKASRLARRQLTEHLNKLLI